MADIDVAPLLRPSFRDAPPWAQARNPYSRWWLWIPGSRQEARPGMTRLEFCQDGKVQFSSSLDGAITARSSSGPGTGGLDTKMSHWFLILSAGNAVTAYISCISW